MAVTREQSDSRTEEASRYLPGGRLATTAFGSATPAPSFEIVRGEGAYVYTDDDKRLLDVSLGGGSILLGHCNPAVSAAVHAQVDRGANFGFRVVSSPALDLARLFVQAVPCAQKVRFVNSASEAALCAVRMVRALTGRDKVLKFEGAYHGVGDTLLFTTNYGDLPNWRDVPEAIPDSPGIPAVERDLVLVAPYNDIDAARSLARARQAELAAIIVEPVMRGIASSPGFLEGVRELADELRIPLIFDETITGFRLAYGGAQQFYGVTPDLAIYGKGLGAGFPIGAVAGKDDVMAALDPDAPLGRRIYFQATCHGNPLCAAAAAANLRELGKPGVYEQLNDYGRRLREGLGEIFGRHGLEPQMTGTGSIVEFFFGPHPITDFRSTLRSKLRYKQLLGSELPLHGVNGGGGRYTASTCHHSEELALMLAAVDEAIGVLKKRGEFS
jgi:glutamate-1-semialdehyde 2,1-aminomutase